MNHNLPGASILRAFSLAMACCLIPMSLSCAQTNTVSPAAVSPTTATPNPQPAPRALWVWDGGVISQKEKSQEFFEFCREKDIGIAYMHLGDFLSDTKREESDPKHVTAEMLGDFLEAAHAHNLRVEALDGDPSFALSEKHESALQRVQRVIEYNRSVPVARRLDGFQWDIEPYILPAFKDEAQRPNVTLQFLEIVKKTRDMVLAETEIAGPKGFWLGFALPFWMDGDTHNIMWNGEKRPVTFHVLHILSTLPQPYLVLMAYRDKPEGTIDVVRAEIEYSAKHTPSVHIVVGQETGAVKNDPPSITFYEEGEGALENAITKIDAEYSTSPVYGGVAIHALNHYQDLIARLPQTPAQPAADGKVALSILTPKTGVQADISTTVSGTASGAANVQLSVQPEGDIWYDGAPLAIGDGGTWSTPVRLGNDKTPAGRRFTIRARLLDAAGKVLQEEQIEVVRR